MFRQSARIVATLAVSLVLANCLGSNPASAEDVIQTLVPPKMPCGILDMSGDGTDLFLLDDCGTIARWNPKSGESSVVPLADHPIGFNRIATDRTRIALLSGEENDIWVFGKNGKFLHKHHYPGETYVSDIAILGDYVAATTWFDDHFLFVFCKAGEPPVRYIKNPQYWPELAPRYRSETDVTAAGSGFVVVDRTNFEVHSVHPKAGTVSTSQKEPDARMPVIEKPDGKWSDSDMPRNYRSVRFATSSTATASEALMVILDSRITDETGYEKYYLEILSTTGETRKWTRRAELRDKYRFAGSGSPTVLGDTLYLYMNKNGVVHAVPLVR